MKFEELEFMSIGCNCTMIGCIDREKRLKGPVDNVNTKSLAGLKLTIENKLYQYIKNTKPLCVDKKPNEFKPGETTVVYKYANNFDFWHNDTTTTKFLTEFNTRCNRLAKFISQVNSSDKKWLTLSLNAFLVKYGTGTLANNTLKEILKYLKDKNLLKKTIILGARVSKTNYKLFSYYLNKETINILQKELNTTLNYIEIVDIDRYNLIPAKNQFKDLTVKLINKLIEPPVKRYLEYNGYFGL